MRDRCFLAIFVLILVNLLALPSHAQLGFDLKVDKPKPYEERVLKAEKTDPSKSFRGDRRFFQNLTTHYNYFFNANNKLNNVIDDAKLAFRDDYTSLLPFYNYTLDATSQNARELDSVIYKSQTGIVMHDLRNDWADNMYLLWGAAWFFEKKFDSAALMFQFINYAFAEKEKDGYYRYIGSRLDGNSALSISTKENRSFPKNMVTPPSRNNAFIWQARTFIELGDIAGAGTMIATLKNDPLFPSRLRDDLEEVEAYWYYKQGIWDSSAVHLLKALGQAKNKQEKARWEFLAAQMLEKSGKTEEAQKLYSKAIAHTADPVMDVYGRLNIVRLQKDTASNYIDRNIAELLKMARRDKYTDYRDVIYFMAAQMELERNNIAAAQELLLKGAKYNNGNLSSRSRSYLLIADLSYDQKKYLQAAVFYDSIQTKDLDKPEAIARVEQRKPLLSRVTAFSNSINREDSLQRIAALPETERDALINKIVKQLRKQQGLDDATPTSGNPARPNSTPDLLFPSSQPKGEWYFYNSTLKTRGEASFKQVWGSRPNVDNWRRFADVNQQLLAKTVDNTRGQNLKNVMNDQVEDLSPSYEKLLSALPLTDARMAVSNDSLRAALYGLGILYLNDMEDYPSAIETLEKLRERFPDYARMDEVLFNLYYAYKKAGKEADAARVKNLISAKYPQSRYAAILTTGKDPVAVAAKTEESTKEYERIYDMFIAGRFAEAIEAKRIADSSYKTNSWQPQLLYIESVYYIKQRNDSAAKMILQTLISQNPMSPMANKAQDLIAVLNRRAQIEDELTKLEIQRPPADSNIAAPVVQRPVTQPLPRDTMATVPPKPKPDLTVTSPPVKNDSLRIAPPVKKDTIAKVTPVKKDSTSQKPKVDLAKNTPKKDSVAKKPVVSKPPSIYSADTAAKYYAIVILNKVDPLFVVEVKNAFFRYNRERHGYRPLDLTVREFDADNQILLVGGFNGARDVAGYLEMTRRLAATEIMPWLKADRYSFSVLNEANLNTLFERKNLDEYRKFLDQNLPVKF